MKNIRGGFQRASDFLRDVGVEMRKTSWPSRRELVESTVVVLVFIALLSAFISLSDWVILSALRWITNAG